MNWKAYLLLGLLGFAVVTSVASLQPTPGYLDADYYFAGGLQLCKGNGFNEPYLWNYLDDPLGLPHPSHAYWMPLTSLLVAAGCTLIGSTTWFAGRSLIIFIAALIPPVVAAMGWSFHKRTDMAFLSGVLSLFPVFYLVYLPVPDTFSIMIFLGAIFFLILRNKTSLVNPVLLGLISGLMHLARADGFLWLVVALAAYFLGISSFPRKSFSQKILSVLLILAGYMLIMGPWFLRNISVFGSPLAPGGSRMFWLTSYDQLFAFPASDVNFQNWIKSGFPAILNARWWALGLNLATAIAVQGEVILFPFIAVGFWFTRKDKLVILAGFLWFAILITMTFLFPFAGARGGFFHSGASLQAVWWSLVPVGLEKVVEWAVRIRNWNLIKSIKVFRSSVVVLVIFMSGFAIYSRMLSGGAKWGLENIAYRQTSDYLVSNGMKRTDVVVVANPPGFYLASGNPAIAVPDGTVNILTSLSAKYGARYIVLENGAVPASLTSLYEYPETRDNLQYIGRAGTMQVYEIQP